MEDRTQIDGGQFGRVWVDLLESNLSPMGKLAYGVVTSFGGRCWASQTSIARRMGVKHRDTAAKAILELEKAGWLIVERGLVGTNKIIALNPCPIGGGGMPIKQASTMPIKQAQSDKALSEKKNHTGSPLEASFNNYLWNYYPKPRRIDKQAALKEWLKLKPEQAVCERIKADLLRREEVTDWKKENYKFVPYPVRYIKGKRWEDEQGPSQKQFASEAL